MKVVAETTYESLDRVNGIETWPLCAVVWRRKEGQWAAGLTIPPIDPFGFCIDPLPGYPRESLGLFAEATVFGSEEAAEQAAREALFAEARRRTESARRLGGKAAPRALQFGATIEAIGGRG